MELTETIARRRSIRKYLEKDVDETLIQALLESARLCQSAKNRQPWRFMTLRGEMKNRVADTMLALFEERDIDVPGYMNSSKHTARIIKQAPVLLLVLREADEIWLDADYLSIGAAIEHICLRAVDLGLGALWIRDTVYTENELLKLIGWPELDLVSAIAVGYADESPAQRPRLSIDELTLSPR